MQVNAPHNITEFAGQPFTFGDTFTNFLTGLGIPGRDRVMSMFPILNLISQDWRSLDALYRSDWLSRKIVDLPAYDTCRAWRSWHADDDQIEKLEETERSMGVQNKVMEAMTKARLFGGAAMILGVEGTGGFETELKLDRVKKGSLKFIHVVQKWQISAGARVLDITSPWYGEPTYYQRSNRPVAPAPGGVAPIPQSSLGYKVGEVLYIHPSRVLRFVGAPYADIEMAIDVWGDSVLQVVHDAIRDASLVGQSVAQLVARANVDVIKVPSLSNILSTANSTATITERFAKINAAKSVINSVLLDSTEEWQQIQINFGGLYQLHQLFLQIASGAADIPATRLLGREPAGQNATGESDLRNYYDRLSSDQEVRIRPLLTPLDEVLIRHTFDDRDEDIYYEWNPLWQLEPQVKADMALKKAQAYLIDVNTGLIPPEVLMKARQNQLIEDGTYPGLESAIDEFEDSIANDYVPPAPGMSAGKQTQAQFGGPGPQGGGAQNSNNVGGPKGGGPNPKPNGKANGFQKDEEGFQQALSFRVPSSTLGRKRRRKFGPPAQLRYAPLGDK